MAEEFVTPNALRVLSHDIQGRIAQNTTRLKVHKGIQKELAERLSGTIERLNAISRRVEELEEEVLNLNATIESLNVPKARRRKT